MEALAYMQNHVMSTKAEWNGQCPPPSKPRSKAKSSTATNTTTTQNDPKTNSEKGTLDMSITSDNKHDRKLAPAYDLPAKNYEKLPLDRKSDSLDAAMGVTEKEDTPLAKNPAGKTNNNNNNIQQKDRGGVKV